MSPLGIHTHEALFYRDDRDYLDGLNRFLTPAFAAGEPVTLVLPRPRLELAREWLNEAPNVDLLDMYQVGRNPGRILSIIERLRQEHRGETLNYVGEPIWPGRRPEEIREAVRHEALINVALERNGTRTRVLCPYDAARLDEAVLKSAKRTHPTIVEGGAAQPSACYSDVVPPECELPLDEPPSDALRCAVRDGSLASLRAAIRRRLGDRLNRDVLSDLQIVANELATNALQHGSPPRRLTVWQTARRVICQVDNEGAISDPLAGRRHPHPTPGHGMGLWIVHHLCELVEVRNRSGTTVRAHLMAA